MAKKDRFVPHRPDLKLEGPAAVIEEAIRDAVDKIDGVDQHHVDKLAEAGIEIMLFQAWARIDDLERRVAQLED